VDHGEGVLVIATELHAGQFKRELTRFGRDVDLAILDRQIVFLDAHSTLTRFLVNGEPDAARFEAVIRAAIREVRPCFGGLRAYGEMVGLLWSAGRFSAAVRLEELWNTLLSAVGFKLFCAYPIDIFNNDVSADAVESVLRAHTHLLPTGNDGDLENALSHAVTDVLGTTASSMDLCSGKATSAVVIPRGEAAIMSLRSSDSAGARDVLSRAREYYQRERRFRSLVEHSLDGILLLDEQLKILYASASTKNVLGYEPNALESRNGFELVHPDDVDDVRRTLADATARPRCPIQRQFRALRSDRTWRWIESTLTNLLDDPDVKAVVCNYRDITDRKLAEERQRRDAEELARSYADLQAFAYAAAHDLQEPLRTVCAYTQLLVQRARLDGDDKAIAGLVVDGVKRMSALLDDMLSLTRVSFGARPDRVDLREAAQQAIANLEHAIHESSAEIGLGDLPSVQGNEIHTVTLFQNLLSNAIKYRSDSPIQIRIAAEQAGSDWIIKVTDNGVGIAPEYHDQVFGLFKRLHGRDIPGTGVGLAICKKIVEGMGGKIWVESEVGKGSTFCFTAADYAPSLVTADDLRTTQT
jgi:PAS domain S-box-containing protein